MAGIKRSRDGPRQEPKQDDGSAYFTLFDSFRAELDEHHDRRERVNKASRDITAMSKKIIFNCQRAPSMGSPLPQTITKVTGPMLAQIEDLFKSVEADLQDINAFRYQRQISSGIQEFMEAVLFQHYLETGQLMTYEQATKMIPADVMLTEDDYILGIFDMTGEVMKYAVTYLASHRQLPSADVLSNMRLLRACLESVDASPSYGLNREFEKKLATTKQSVEKVEYQVYNMLVKGKEKPAGWRPPDAAATDGAGEEVEAY